MPTQKEREREKDRKKENNRQFLFEIMSNAATSNQESSSNDRRFLHFTMKITKRLETKNFVCNILGMKVLRHEEMDDGCAAQCNGDYQSPWSKTMA